MSPFDDSTHWVMDFCNLQEIYSICLPVCGIVTFADLSDIRVKKIDWELNNNFPQILLHFITNHSGSM